MKSKNFYLNEYRPFHQMPYCCVPATLQWILYRRGLDILDQELIGAGLGLRIPQRFAKYFRNKRIKILKNDSGEFGTQITKEKYSINNFFKKYKIPLEISEEYKFAYMSDLESFILDNLNSKQDIVLRYNNKIFKKNGEQSVGHFSLIVGYHRENQKVIIGDPEPPFFKETTLNKVLFAISDKIDNVERGIYIVKKRK